MKSFSKVTTNDDIKNKDYNLSVHIYAPIENDDKHFEKITLEQTISNWQQSSYDLRTSLNDLITTLQEVGLDERET